MAISLGIYPTFLDKPNTKAHARPCAYLCVPFLAIERHPAIEVHGISMDDSYHEKGMLLEHGIYLQ